MTSPPSRHLLSGRIPFLSIVALLIALIGVAVAVQSCEISRQSHLLAEARYRDEVPQFTYSMINGELWVKQVAGRLDDGKERNTIFIEECRELISGASSPFYISLSIYKSWDLHYRSFLRQIYNDKYEE